MRRSIRFIFRGTPREISAFDPSTTLLEWLRLEAGATGTKEGCNEGDCGACTVVLAKADGDRIRYLPVNACILLLGQIDSTELLTVEDLAKDGTLHPVQAAMVRHHGSQCGFCTPGIIMSLFAAFHEASRPPDREAIGNVLAGNLCRCTGYRPIFDAAFDVLSDPPEDRFSEASAARLEALKALEGDRDIVVGNEDRFFASPRHLDGLAEMIARHPEATVLAGSTDVGLWVTKKLAPLRRVISLGRVTALTTLAEGSDSAFFGAGVTLAQALPVLEGIDSDLGMLMRRFGSAQVRASGTVGGNIANGSPIGDLAPALIALGATLHLRAGAKSRTLPLEDFFLDYGKQDRAPGEFVTGITVPRLETGSHFRCFKISKRTDEDISSVMGAFRLAIADGAVTGARIAFGGMAGTPKRATGAEEALKGAALANPHDWMAAVQALEADYQPISDMRASARYRARVARALLGKALTEIAGSSRATRINPRVVIGEVQHG
ncbi:MAG TPA: xanthine dehydrogenase small subunit [Rhabdaerophilum sp.]|nr:xanthine dehydrogenase small subunit [Rhabdaerophilum sp.]